MDCKNFYYLNAEKYLHFYKNIEYFDFMQNRSVFIEKISLTEANETLDQLIDLIKTISSIKKKYYLFFFKKDVVIKSVCIKTNNNLNTLELRNIIKTAVEFEEFHYFILY